ncbi:uncharacterized protein LOC8038544 isoform X1 [Ixodes scapularis]|uniref:uncharacterized protein LOC8038544 isoform X1 n=2 Tax=Ixodes scapularis TaxID=6945 RepID=UPI001A9FB9BE|nr:uncharacterized protein LOC8038544 isoform X1 [Ixodes scapularis]
MLPVTATTSFSSAARPRSASDGLPRQPRGPLLPLARMPVRQPRRGPFFLQTPSGTGGPRKPSPVMHRLSQAQHHLQEVWNLVNDFCGTLCNHLHQPHQFLFNERPDLLLERPVLVEAYRCIAHIMEHMSRILRHTEAEKHGIQDVGNAFVQSLEELLGILRPREAGRSVHSGVTGPQMLDFLLNGAHKDMSACIHREMVLLHEAIGECVVKILSSGSPKTAKKKS